MTNLYNKNDIKNDENGHIVVETIGTFIPLVLLMISILSLVNIVAVQARVHYALTQSAKALSIYSYSLKNTGSSESGTILNDLSAVFTGINIMTRVGADASDSISTLNRLIDHSQSGSFNQVPGVVIYPLVERYLTNENISGREFLSRFAVSDFDLSSSVILDDNKNIKLTVNYKVDYLFGALPLPFGPKLNITQTAVTKSWITGSGMGYK